MERIISQHIECSTEKCGGKPVVAGTRIRVWDIHIWHNLRGQSPEEIVASFPELTVSDVHASLAYYFDHQEVIENQMKETDSFVATIEGEQGATRFSRLRDALLEGRDVNDSISSG